MPEHEYHELGSHQLSLTFILQKLTDGENTIWEGHCLELDLFAAGRTLQDALRSLEMVSQDMYLEYLNHDGPDGLERKRAPQSDFDEFRHRHGTSPAIPWREVCARQDELSYVATTGAVHARMYQVMTAPESPKVQPFWDERSAS